MEKIDYKKVLKEFYTSQEEPKTVIIPKLKYITVTGKGNPNTSIDFKHAVEALFGLAYTIKFMIKKGETNLPPRDFVVMPLEGQWWADNWEDFQSGNKDKWKFKVMIMMPEFLTKEVFKEAKNKLHKKKKPIALDLVKFEEIEDGLSAQIMHTGSYDNEHDTVSKLHRYIEDQSYRLSGLHREIYLSDFRKIAPEKMKTIIRQQMH